MGFMAKSEVLLLQGIESGLSFRSIIIALVDITQHGERYFCLFLLFTIFSIALSIRQELLILLHFIIASGESLEY
jgi:hypothetical protein